MSINIIKPEKSETDHTIFDMKNLMVFKVSLYPNSKSRYCAVQSHDDLYRFCAALSHEGLVISSVSQLLPWDTRTPRIAVMSEKVFKDTLKALKNSTEKLNVEETIGSAGQSEDSECLCETRWKGVADVDYLVSNGCFDEAAQALKESDPKKYEEFLAEVENRVDWDSVSDACCEAGNNIILSAMSEVADEMGILESEDLEAEE